VTEKCGKGSEQSGSEPLLTAHCSAFFRIIIFKEFIMEGTKDFECTVGNGEVTITSYKGSGKDLTIPGRIDGLPVTAIKDTEIRVTGIVLPLEKYQQE
jgi:hypothetical protein